MHQAHTTFCKSFASSLTSAAGEAYRERLLVLPRFLLSAQHRLAPGDIGAGLTLTGHFLATCVFDPLNRPLPPARERLIERLGEKGML